MQRQALDTGGWIDVHKATDFQEATYWNGSNLISRATGSQWDHEALYRSVKGRWVLCCWSQREGTPEGWTEIDHDQAAQWLVRNGHEHGELASLIADLEV